MCMEKQWIMVMVNVGETVVCLAQWKLENELSYVQIRYNYSTVCLEEVGIVIEIMLNYKK